MLWRSLLTGRSGDPPAVGEVQRLGGVVEVVIDQSLDQHPGEEDTELHDTNRWVLVCDRWHTGFVDAAGTEGLLGRVQGRQRRR